MRRQADRADLVPETFREPFTSDGFLTSDPGASAQPGRPRTVDAGSVELPLERWRDVRGSKMGWPTWRERRWIYCGFIAAITTGEERADLVWLVLLASTVMLLGWPGRC